MCEICSKLTIKTPERRYWRRPGVFIVNFEHLCHSYKLPVFTRYYITNQLYIALGYGGLITQNDRVQNFVTNLYCNI